MLDVRPSPIAGQWYEGDAKALARTVDEYLNNAQLPELDGEVIAVIAPHAGHKYSGAVAGYAFSALRRAPEKHRDYSERSDDPELVEGEERRQSALRLQAEQQPPSPPLRAKLVAVIAPMHHPYREPLITTSHDAYRTPLGDVPVDKDAMNELDLELRSELGFGLSPVSNDPEHSLEIELPFLQRALTSEWKLLPVMVRAQEPRVSQGLGKALAKVLRDKNFVMVASADLSHFYNQQTALKYDRAMLDEIESFNPDGAFQVERDGRISPCLPDPGWRGREIPRYLY